MVLAAAEYRASSPHQREREREREEEIERVRERREDIPIWMDRDAVALSKFPLASTRAKISLLALSFTLLRRLFSSTQYGSSSFRPFARSPLLSCLRPLVSRRVPSLAHCQGYDGFRLRFCDFFVLRFFRRLFCFFFWVFLEELVSRMNVGCVAYFEGGKKKETHNHTWIQLYSYSGRRASRTVAELPANVYILGRATVVLHFRRSSPFPGPQRHLRLGIFALRQPIVCLASIDLGISRRDDEMIERGSRLVR